MIRSWADRGTQDVYNGLSSPAARKACPHDLWTVAHRKLDLLNAAHDLRDLRIPPANRLEALKGDRKGQHSIRINDQFRIVFTWHDDGPHDVAIVDYH